MNYIEELKNKINESKNIAVLHHTVPDGDAIGSSFALCLMLKKMGKKAEVLMEKPLHKEFHFLGGKDDIVSFSQSSSYDLIITCDCSDTKRLTVFEKLFKNQKNTINIDHHITNENFAKINIVDAKASSACELLYLIFKELSWQTDKTIRNYLYCGIIRDSGGFMNDNTTARTHQVAGEMIEQGIDDVTINRNLMRTNSIKSMLLLKCALNNMNFNQNKKLVWSNLSLDDYKTCDAVLEDSGAIVGQLVSIEDVEISMMISESTPNVHKISLRSKNDIDVSLICKAFGGGGHKKASGCQLKGKINNVVNQMTKEIAKYI